MAVQTCDQVITYRNFDYARALEVVQDEQYLDDVDFDEIRLRHKQGEVFKAIDYFNEKIENNLLSQRFQHLGEFDNEYEESHHREKRFSFIGSSCGSTDDTIITNGIDLDFPTFIDFSPEIEGDAQNLLLCYTVVNIYFLLRNLSGS